MLVIPLLLNGFAGFIASILWCLWDYLDGFGYKLQHQGVVFRDPENVNSERFLYLKHMLIRYRMANVRANESQQHRANAMRQGVNVTLSQTDISYIKAFYICLNIKCILNLLGFECQITFLFIAGLEKSRYRR